MSRSLRFRAIAAAFAIGLGLCTPGQTGAATAISSPNKKVRLEILEGGRYQLLFQGRPVILPSPLVFKVENRNLASGGALEKVERYEINERYPWRGVHSVAHDHSQGATLWYQAPDARARWRLEARVSNDGAAFRFLAANTADSTRVDEASEFRLPPKSTVWAHDLRGHYEATYRERLVEEIPPEEWAAPPVTFALPDGKVYAAITEAALFRYSGMALRKREEGFQLALGHEHPISYPYQLRYSNDISRVTNLATIKGDIVTPWRVILVGSDLNTLVNSDLVHNLCPPADPKLFPKGMNTDWVRPGRAVWRYLDGGANTFDSMKEFSRLAGELGFEYHVIEGFWSRWPESQLRELVDYSRQQKVGLWLWRHSRELRTAQAREQFFSLLERVGAVGAKIDFFDHEHREVVELYEMLLRDAARHRILVNFHGANKPTGESRTWPNEMIREGVRGMESSRLQERARHATTLPFTRFLAGHGDYTPVHFGARRGDTTPVHQIATAAVFNEPLLTYGAHPTNLLQHPALPMIRSIPAVWDETVVLPQSEIGELVAMARRSGRNWFLAILNGTSGRQLEIPLQFLPRGAFKSSVLEEPLETNAPISLKTEQARRGRKLKITLPPGGGYLARFEPN